MRLQIRNQDATRSVRFPTESVAGPPSDQEAFAPDPPDDGNDADGYVPDADVNTDDEASTNYGVEVDDDSISEDEELDNEEKKNKPPSNTQMLTKFREFCDSSGCQYFSLTLRLKFFPKSLNEF